MEENKSKKGLEYMPISSKRNNKMSYTEMKKIVEEDKRKNAESKRPVSESKRKKQTRRKISTKVAILAAVGLLGISGIGGYVLGARNNKVPGITDGKNSIEVDMNEVEKDVEIENVLQRPKEDKHDIFVKELQDAALNEDVEKIYKLEQDVAVTIEGLNTPKEVLDYTKQFVVDKYNSQNEEKIEIEDVTLEKNVHNLVFYEDQAQNGDEILRYCTEKEAEEMGIRIDGGLAKISATIETENGKKEFNVAYHDGKYVTLYGKNEEVLENEDNLLCELGNVVLTGIDRQTSMVQEDTDYLTKNQYKNRFVEAVIDYRKSKGDFVEENDKTQMEQSTEEEFETGKY